METVKVDFLDKEMVAIKQLINDQYQDEQKIPDWIRELVLEELANAGYVVRE